VASSQCRPPMVPVTDGLDRRRAKGGDRLSASSMFTFIQEQTPLSETSLPPGHPGRGMQAEARDNPVHRLPDWRTTLPLAQSCPAVE
jgi:hypothetical protein